MADELVFASLDKSVPRGKQMNPVRFLKKLFPATQRRMLCRSIEAEPTCLVALPGDGGGVRPARAGG
jgi:hypothetical protein